jgi:photosystem II stability/assembly factor-like uncharacterized protein
VLTNPTLEVIPKLVKEGDNIILEGSGWCDCPIKIEIDNETARDIRIAQGFPVPNGVLPDPAGSFVVMLSTLGVQVGNYRIRATSIHQTKKMSVTKTFEVVKRQMFKPDGTVADKPYRRTLDFFNRRFAHIGFVPQGVTEIQKNEIQLLRKKDQTLFSLPVSGSCNWNPVGAGPEPNAAGKGFAASGRVAAVAIDPNTPSTIYIGTASGGVWKSMDDGLTWAPKTDYEITLGIGAVAIDPFNPSRIFAGTGEYSFNWGSYGNGHGILRSEDGGSTWKELATDKFEHDRISRIIFDTTDTASKRMFLSSDIGVFETTDSGNNWTLLRPGTASDLVMVVEKVASSKKAIKLIAAFHGSGLWTSSGTLEKGRYKWSKWTQFTSTAFPASIGRIVLGQSKNHPETIYALFALYEGFDDRLAGLAKTENAGKKWTPVAVRLNTSIGPSPSSVTSKHYHNTSIPAAHMTAIPIRRSYATDSSGTPSHTHKVSFTAEEIEQLAAGRLVKKDTDADSSGHQHRFDIGAWFGNSWYNLHIAVHPNDTKIVYFAEKSLWKTTAGGGIFNRITDGEPTSSTSPGAPIGMHVDQHCFAFDPKNPDIVWAGNDGGIYRSTNGGKTWSHRNFDLATFQYITISLHPSWETVILGGTQDNGLHRYSGSPAWEFSDDGDAGFTAIDPDEPTRMYHGYVHNDIYRSDKAGANGSWEFKKGEITGDAVFYPPFLLDPSYPEVCYFGNSKLWRSPDYADNWFAITRILNGMITAMAINPEDSTAIYVGTNKGSIYRVRKKGISWDLSNVITTDLTKPPIPPGIYISDIAVDAVGTLWITTASLLLDASGKFTNDYVYCMRPTGSYIWESRSNGLAKANPIHSIVIDPTNNDRLFCGGDVGVFRTEDGGLNWKLWDQGLPNVNVQDLVIGPRRLLRAATYGRSVWERPIDSGFCPLVDLYLRDNILDSGRVQPTPSGQPHPFDPKTNVYWWQSPDVKVDAKEPEFQTLEPVTDYVAFESDLRHRKARRSSDNRFYVQIHNRGVKKATNVQIRAFFAPAAAGLPRLPSDFWSGGSPFKRDPTAIEWRPVGPTQIIPELEAGEPGIIKWNWKVPSTASEHSCLLVLTTCAEDPIKMSDIYDVSVLASASKHVTLKNLHVDYPVPGVSSPDNAYILELHDPENHEVLIDLIFNWGSLPKETKMFVVFESLEDNEPTINVKLADLENLGITIINGKEKNLFHEELEYKCGQIKHFNPESVYELSPIQSNTTTSIIPSVRIPEGRPLIMAINLVLPNHIEQESVQFDVIQRVGQRIIGGSTYILHPQKRTIKRKIQELN